MELDQKIGGLEDQLAESKTKIDHLTLMVKELVSAKESTNGGNTLKKIEDKLNSIADSSMSSGTKGLLSELRDEIKDKQGYFENKIGGIEKSISQLSDKLIDQSDKADRSWLKEDIENVKKGISGLSAELILFHSNIDEVNEKLKNIEQNNHKSNSLNFENLSVINEDIGVISKKFNAVLEILQVSSTVDNIEELRDDISQIGKNFHEFQESFNNVLDKLNSGINNLVETDLSKKILNELDNNSTKVNNKLQSLENGISSANNKFIELQGMIKALIELEGRNNSTESLRKITENLSLLPEGKVYDDFRNSLNELISEKQQDIEDKIKHLDKLLVQLSENVQLYSSGAKTDSKTLCDEIENVKTGISSFSKDMLLFQDTIESVSEKLNELGQNNQRANSINFDNISIINNDIAAISKKFNAVLEILKTSSTVNDVEEIKDEIGLVNNNIVEFQDHFNSSVEKLNTNINGIIEKDFTREILNELGNTNTKFSNKLQNLENIVNTTNIKFNELTGHIDQSNNQVKDGISEVLRKDYTLEVRENMSDLSHKLTDKLINIEDQINKKSTHLADLCIQLNSSVSEEIKAELSEDLGKFYAKVDALQEELSSTARDLYEMRKYINSESSEALSAIRTTSETLDINLNAAMSAISIMDIKLKDLTEGIERAASSRDVTTMRDTLTSSANKVNILLEILKSTPEDINSIKNGLISFNDNITELQKSLELSINSFRETLPKLLEKSITGELKNELAKNSSNIKNYISENSSREALENIKLSNEELDLGINSAISAISILDIKLETLADNLNKSTSIEDLAKIKDELAKTSLKINSVLEAVKQTSSPTAEIKGEIEEATARYLELQSNINLSMEEIKQDILSLMNKESAPAESFDMEEVSRLLSDRLESLKGEMNASGSRLEEKISSLFEAGLSAEIKEEISATSSKLIEIQSYVNAIITQLEENVNKLLEQGGSEEIKSEIESVHEKLSGRFEYIENELNTANSRFNQLFDIINSANAELKEDLNGLICDTNQHIIDDLYNVNSRLEEIQISNSNSLKEYFEGLSGNDITEEFRQEIQNTNSNLQNLNISIPLMVDDISYIRNSLGNPYINEGERIITVFEFLETLKRKLSELEDFSRFNSEEMGLLQDKLNISSSNSMRPIKDELVDLNEKILDLKEYFSFHNKDGKNYAEELDLIISRFNDIWTNAGLTIDKLAEKTITSTEAADRFEEAVQKYLDTIEDTNLLITNILKKTSDTSGALNEVNGNLENLNTNSIALLKNFAETNEKLEGINHNLYSEFDRVIARLNDVNEELASRFSTAFESDFNFLRTDIIEFKDKQESIIDENVRSQESIQNSLSNLHFSITDSADSLTKKLSEISSNLDKLNNSSSANKGLTENVRTALVQIAEWIDGAEQILAETNENVRTIKNNEDVIKLSSELKELNDAVFRISSDIKTKVEVDITDIKEELNQAIDEVKKSQENEFENIHTNITGISQEIAVINHALSGFETSFRQNIKALNSTLSEKLDSSKDSADLSSITEQLESGLGEVQKDISRELSKINERFTGLERNMDAIQVKLDSLERKQSDKDPEITNLLEFIAGQVAAANEAGKGTGILLKRFAVMEKRIADFDSSLKQFSNYLSDE